MLFFNGKCLFVFEDLTENKVEVVGYIFFSTKVDETEIRCLTKSKIQDVLRKKTLSYHPTLVEKQRHRSVTTLLPYLVNNQQI